MDPALDEYVAWCRQREPVLVEEIRTIEKEIDDAERIQVDEIARTKKYIQETGEHPTREDYAEMTRAVQIMEEKRKAVVPLRKELRDIRREMARYKNNK